MPQMKKISRALEIAQAAEFVSKLPEGLDTMIQQGGRNFVWRATPEADDCPRAGWHAADFDFG